MHVRWPRRATAVAVVLIVLVALVGNRTRAQQPAPAAAYPEAMFAGLKWRSLGPDPVIKPPWQAPLWTN